MKYIVQSIINSGKMGSMVITGGGVSAIAELLKYGGGSKFLIAGIIPYNNHYLSKYTHRNKDFVSKEACRELVDWADRESVCATRLSFGEIVFRNVVAVGVTAKLTYEGERQNREHCAYIGFRGLCKEEYYRWTPMRAHTDRARQEQDLSYLILSYLSQFLGASGEGRWNNMELLTRGQQ